MTYQPSDKMRDCEKQEEYTARTQKSRQSIHHKSNLRRVFGKLREDICRQHKNRRARRMPNFQLISARNKFRTVP